MVGQTSTLRHLQTASARSAPRVALAYSTFRVATGVVAAAPYEEGMVKTDSPGGHAGLDDAPFAGAGGTFDSLEADLETGYKTASSVEDVRLQLPLNCFCSGSSSSLQETEVLSVAAAVAVLPCILGWSSTAAAVDFQGTDAEVASCKGTHLGTAGSACNRERTSRDIQNFAALVSYTACDSSGPERPDSASSSGDGHLCCPEW